ncbi:F-box domain-containing protein [Mycena kentingensis (nom. inval.)]|nr:F-box domain-containing protein [Mycena kentingensis (nom. inval.)]
MSFPSPFSAVLGTNYSPDDSEIPAIYAWKLAVARHERRQREIRRKVEIEDRATYLCLRPFSVDSGMALLVVAVFDSAGVHRPSPLALHPHPRPPFPLTLFAPTHLPFTRFGLSVGLAFAGRPSSRQRRLISSLQFGAFFIALLLPLLPRFRALARPDLAVSDRACDTTLILFYLHFLSHEREALFHITLPTTPPIYSEESEALRSPPPFHLLLTTSLIRYTRGPRLETYPPYYILRYSIDLKPFEQKIQALKDALSAATLERDAVRAQISAHIALVAPIHRIPVEILQRIFIECLPEDRNCSMGLTEPPMLLARVSSRWRHAAYSEPRLWSRLHVRVPNFPPFGRNCELRRASNAQLVLRRITAVQWWLDKSGVCPLSISLHADAAPLQLVEALAAYAARWKVIVLKADVGTFLPPLLALSPNAVPLLESLFIDERFKVGDLGQLRVAARLANMSNPVQVWNAAGALRAPKLRCFSLESPLVLKPLELPLAWGQLTSLALNTQWSSGNRGTTSSVVLSILDRCPQLRQLSAVIYDSAAAQVVKTEEITHGNLRSLQLFYATLCPTTPFALLGDHLTLPALSRFDWISAVESTVPLIPDQSFLDHFVVQATQLRSLSISIGLFSQREFTHLLDHLPPCIRVLRFPGCGNQGPSGDWRFHERGAQLDDTTLARLVPSLLPQLQELQVEGNTQFCDVTLFSFITKRLGSNQSQNQTQLKRVHIVYSTVRDRMQVRELPDAILNSFTRAERDRAFCLETEAAKGLGAMEKGAIPGFTLLREFPLIKASP